MSQVLPAPLVIIPAATHRTEAELFRFQDGQAVRLAVISWNYPELSVTVREDGESAGVGKLQYGDAWTVPDCRAKLVCKHADGLHVWGDVPPGTIAAVALPVTADAIVQAMADDDGQTLSDFLVAILSGPVVRCLEASVPPMATWHALKFDRGIGAAFVHEYIRRIVRGPDSGPMWRAEQVLSVWKYLAFDSLTLTIDQILLSESGRENVVF